jgi:polar amino acid transport system substrate-binding protein
MFKMKRKVIAIILGLLFIGSFVTAQELTIYTENSENGHFNGTDGKPKGYVIDLIKEIQKIVGDNSEVKIVPWARAYAMATKEPNVLLFSTTFTEARRDLFKWIGPLTESYWALYAKADSSIVLNSIEDAKKLKAIGCYLGDAREAYLKEKGFTNLESINNDNMNVKKLLAGRIDLWISSSGKAAYVLGQENIDPSKIKNVLNIKTFGLYFTFSKDTPDKTVQKWNDAFEKLKKDGTMANIYKKWDQAMPTYQIPPRP